MPKLRLIYLPVSPWSERARWALDHHGLSYTTSVHVPFLGERALRKLVGPGVTRATVPVLIADGVVLRESWDIALYADRAGTGTPLIPPDREAEVRRYTELADRMMASGRALVTDAMIQSPGALEEALPPEVPRWLRGLLRPVTRYTMRWFARKYGVSDVQRPARVAEIRAALLELRAALAAGSGTLLGGFTYADIVVATGLQGVSPVDHPAIRLGPATRQAWTVPELAGEFADLLAWRDRIYAEHRPRPAR